MSATDAVARMLTLIPWLLERPGASLEETASAFGVRVETIRRDLEQLDFCGLPGLGGGDLFDVSLIGERVVVQMADELRRPLRPTPSEALRLVLTAGAVGEVLGDTIPALRSAVDKVRAALGVDEDVATILELGPNSAMAEARRALEQGRRLRLLYQGRADEAPRERIVDPWALHVVDGVWYVQGHDVDAEGERTFRLDRAADAQVLPEPASVPAPTDLPPPRYLPSPDDLEVVIDADSQARWLLDALEVDEVVESSSSTLRLTFRTDAPRWVTRLVLMAAGHARVVTPGQVGQDVVREAGTALSRYPPEGD